MSSSIEHEIDDQKLVLELHGPLDLNSIRNLRKFVLLVESIEVESVMLTPLDQPRGRCHPHLALQFIHATVITV